jgi:phage terminase large subunit-like protein
LNPDKQQTAEEIAHLAKLARAKNKLALLESQQKLFQYYPETGPLRRELYPKHMEFFRLGEQHRERLALCANRVGKTEGMGGYEMAVHLSGRYPDWWEGARFDSGVKAWVAGDTARTVRDIIQSKLLGAPGAQGTGLIPGADIIKTTPKQGIPDAIDSVYVNHQGRGQSRLLFKSYDQGREVFQGEEVDIIWLDEECPLDIYNECVLRTMTTDGIVMLTFTPIKGLTPTVQYFLEKSAKPIRNPLED